MERPNRRIASPWLPPKLGQREMVGKKSIYMGDAPLLTPLACRGRPLGAAVWLGVAQGQRSTMGKLLLVLKLKMTMGLYLPQLRRGGGVVELLRRAAAVGGASSSSSSSSSSPFSSPFSSLFSGCQREWEMGERGMAAGGVLCVEEVLMCGAMVGVWEGGGLGQERAGWALPLSIFFWAIHR